jgi:hypothetical protein
VIGRLIQLVLITAMLLLSVGCGSGAAKRTQVTEDQIDEILQFHNQRVASIERLWARVSVRIKATDARGEWFEEQGEGHIQITRPESVSLTIGKLGETYFAYGSGTDQYWMYDLSDSNNRVALIGSLDKITPERAAEVGLSVHPADLITVLGIEPIDPDSIIETRWEESSGLIAIRFPSRLEGWGETEYWFDPGRGLPILVRSLDVYGERLATTGLTRYKDILDDHKLDSGIQVPGKVEVRDPRSQGGFIRIELSEPSQKAIRAMVYNPARLSRAYRIHETIDLDEERTDSMP